MLKREEVLKIAKLANLKLDDQEVEKMGILLGEALDYIKVIDELDTSKVVPTSQVTGVENVYDEDVVRESLTQEQALSNGKATREGFFVTGATLKKHQNEKTK